MRRCQQQLNSSHCAHSSQHHGLHLRPVLLLRLGPVRVARGDPVQHRDVQRAGPVACRCGAQALLRAGALSG